MFIVSKFENGNFIFKKIMPDLDPKNVRSVRFLCDIFNLHVTFKHLLEKMVGHGQASFTKC